MSLKAKALREPVEPNSFQVPAPVELLVNLKINSFGAAACVPEVPTITTSPFSGVYGSPSIVSPVTLVEPSYIAFSLFDQATTPRYLATLTTLSLSN